MILGTTFLDFYLVQSMANAKTNFKRNSLLALSIVVNIGLLFYFKYVNFFIENVNHLLSQFNVHQTEWVNVLLPIGISFYTFETITYVVDIYRKVHKPLKNVWDYQLYIMLFPKLIAGPIVRFNDLASQINSEDRRQDDTASHRLMGFYRFGLGLAKKVIIANHVGAQADLIFNQTDYTDLGSGIAWLGILAYSLQIYFDFSGYSDMAIGLARMIGFRFPENFNNPYTATSVTDFWRRWHISLGFWMKNYLYIPLGGNRVHSKARLFLNLWIVFLISGLWHGAAWTFILWGAYHGLFLILERLFLNKFYSMIGNVLSTLITFVIVMIGWVFFRVETIAKGWIYIREMFEMSSLDMSLIEKQYVVFIIVGLVFSFITINKFGLKFQNWFYFDQYSMKKHFIVGLLSLLFIAFSLSYLASSNFNPFIYFRF